MRHGNPRGALKAATLLAGVAGLVIFFVLAPLLALEAKHVYPEVKHLFWPGLNCVWVVAGLCYWALWHIWGAAVEIGRDNSFSFACAGHLRAASRIVACIGAICGLGILGLFLFGLAQPGFLILLALGGAAGATVALYAAAFSKLIQRGAEIKAENELTI